MSTQRLSVLAFAAVLAAALLTGCAAPANSGQSATDATAPRNVSGTEALQMMQDETDYVVVDVRSESEYLSGHVPGAINIPVDALTSEPAELPNKDQLIMVYCRSGARAKTAVSALANMGYTNVVNFGGIMSWPGELETGAAA